MIIECINCSKKFSVNSELIPLEGRTIQCGSCDHIWFFKKNNEDQTNKKKLEILNDLEQKDDNDLSDDILPKKNKKNISTKKNKGSEIVEYTPKKTFTFGKFLSFIIVILISFVAVILLLDTFKGPLYNFFPDLEFVLYSLYETLKDIQLFIMDLI